MANIITNVAFPIKDGVSFTFHAPCNCSDVDGLTVQHPEGETRFVFKDAHGNDLTGINNLFAQGSLIKVVLDVTNNAAFLQNADTNGYLEKQIGVERARIDEMVALRTAGAGTYEYQDNVLDVNVKITTSGAIANLIVTASDLMLGPGETFTFTKIPVAFAPMATQTFNEGFDDSIVVILNESVQNDFVPLTIANTSSGSVSVGGFASVTYPLASISVAELVDARIAVNSNGSTTTHPTAGQAIRAQMHEIHDRVGALTGRVGALEKNGTGGGGAGGGAGVLMVTINEHDEVSHTNAQIYEHYRNGGMVMADYTGNVFTLISAGENYAYFTHATDDPAINALWLEDDSVGSYDEYYLSPGGGSNLLVVTLVDTTGGSKASHTPSQILEHIQNGGVVLLNEDSPSSPCLFHLAYCDQSEAVFTQVYNDECIYYYTVHEDGSHFAYNFNPASAEVIGDINTALDAILAIQKELIGVTLITFDIDNSEYQAEDGMTWADWCDSEYNLRGFHYQNGFVYDENDDKLVHTDGGGENDVKPFDLVLAGGQYRVL